MTLNARNLDLIWNAAAGRPIVTTFRTAPVGVDTPQGPVQAGLDAQGHRHLLVPLAPRHTLKEVVDGEAVVLRRRALEDETSYQEYASLELVDDDLGDLFTALCVEVVDRIAATPERAVAALREVLKDWRSLLAGSGRLLSASALAGLFGELHLLLSALRRDPGAVAFWTGPNGSAQDFHHGLHAVEVKTTTAPEGRSVRIHGADQLDVQPPGRLQLRWLRVRSDQGISVPNLVDEILERTDDRTAFRLLLQKVGYHEADRHIYERTRFDVLEEQTYEVSPGFPRVTPSCLIDDASIAGVGPIDYTLDLSVPEADARRVDLDPADFLVDAP
ncbi:PD-(D/E)XK motif protein [Blastococcus sp. CT_GayMR20]|uniref:PD-(D/E)XK motif protein n=1 Tax=Blastococcus sp. CT_GayMR20 TaxID=2559609 RepID=UPI001073E919|nr:PD-(D/E)XK motif protein [Blastococcus sp. CT_GayMR20]TFV68352.1 PD-(D/E)XK motif protein [Blastococcus sp. CT_GayMR20]